MQAEKSSRRVHKLTAMENCYCTKSELDLFVPRPIQLAIDRSSFLEIFPSSSLADSNTLEFLISGLGDSYFDLSHLFLNVRAKILKENGAAPKITEICAPINYLLNTMFSECHVSLNDRQVESENNYPYKAYLQALLFHSDAAQKNQLSCALYHRDTPGKFDDLDSAAWPNSGFKKRFERVKLGKTFEIGGNLHLSIGSQPKLLINGVSIRIKLEKAKNAFALLSPTDEYQLQLERASLFVRKCEISGSVMLGHEKALEKALIQMPFTRTEIRTFTINSGIKSIVIPNVVNGALPVRCILGMVSNSAYNGDFKKNPFAFKNYDVNNIFLLENGQQIPTSALSPSYSKDFFVRNYFSLFSDLGKHNTNISFESYKYDNALYIFDLTQDFSGGVAHANIIRSGDLAIHLKFEKDLPETLTLIVYLEFQANIEIDKSRSVFTDY